MVEPLSHQNLLNSSHQDDDEVGQAAEVISAGLSDSNVCITTEKLEGRQRRLLAEIHIPFSLEQVWRVLTDYDHLADFVPNLATSQRMPHPSGGIRLEQIGTQCFLNVKVCARVVLDMVEAFPHELGFAMVEGDFRKFEGAWRLEAAEVEGVPGTRLSYDLTLLPPRAMPIGLIERHIRRDLLQNLNAIYERTAWVASQG